MEGLIRQNKGCLDILLDFISNKMIFFTIELHVYIYIYMNIYIITFVHTVQHNDTAHNVFIYTKIDMIWNKKVIKEYNSIPSYIY